MLTSVVFGVFPMVLPANSDPRFSLTIHNASAPDYGLGIGLMWFTPGILLAAGYFFFLYRKFAGKVHLDERALLTEPRRGRRIVIMRILLSGHDRGVGRDPSHWPDGQTCRRAQGGLRQAGPGPGQEEAGRLRPAPVAVGAADHRHRGRPRSCADAGIQRSEGDRLLPEGELDEVFYLSADGTRLIRGAVYDIEVNPFAKDLAKIKTDLQPSMGTPGAPVVIVVYSDFQCAYCREAAKMLRENLLKSYPKEVRLYFKDFPLDQIHPWARPASIAGRCVFRQNPQPSGTSTTGSSTNRLK